MKPAKIPSFVSIVILTTITIIFWVAISVYRALNTKPVPKVAAEILEPVMPSLEKSGLDKVQSRVFFDESQIPISTPLATALATPTASTSATPTATPKGTQ